MINWGVCGEIANMIATGLAAFSIWITIKIQRENNRENKTKFKVEQQAEWYKEIILNDVIPELNAFIIDSNTCIKSCIETKHEEREEKLREAYRTISNGARELLEKIFVVNMFSKSVYRNCDRGIHNILDSYSEIIDEAIQRKYYGTINTRNIQKIRSEIIEQLYSMVESFYK